jgi:hypothetical protein
LIDELQLFERRVAALTQENEARLRETRLHLYDSGAQLVSRSKIPDRPIRENGSFLKLPNKR